MYTVPIVTLTDSELSFPENASVVIIDIIRHGDTSPTILIDVTFTGIDAVGECIHLPLFSSVHSLVSYCGQDSS